jgi:adenosylhomocysteine nucleosidase
MDASPLYAKYEIPLLKKAELPVDLSLQQQLQQAANSFVNSQLTDYIDQQLLQTFEINQPAVYSGKIASGDQFISDPDKLTRLRQDIPGLFCVDMESAAVAQVCYTHQKPFAAVRTISDKADHSAAIDFGKFIKHIANQYCYGILQSWLANVNNQ